MHSGATSRGGFYGALDRFYTRMLHLAMRRRLIVSVLAVLVMLSSIPLYALVKQDFIPSNIDEAEFSVWLTAPEGTSMSAMVSAAPRRTLRQWSIKAFHGCRSWSHFRPSRLAPEDLLAHVGDLACS